MLSFIKCFERVLIKIISDLFPDICFEVFCPILDKFLRNKPLAAPTFYLFQLVPYRLIDGYLLPSYERAPSLTL